MENTTFSRVFREVKRFFNNSSNSASFSNTCLKYELSMHQEIPKSGSGAQDQKVLPDDRNRPLLPLYFSAIQPSDFFYGLIWCDMMLNPNLKPSQIGIRCSGTRKCSQMIEIDYFCLCIFHPFNLPKFYCNPVGGPSVYTSNVRYTYKTTLKLAKVSELEVGTFWAALRVRCSRAKKCSQESGALERKSAPRWLKPVTFACVFFSQLEVSFSCFRVCWVWRIGSVLWKASACQ